MTFQYIGMHEQIQRKWKKYGRFLTLVLLRWNIFLASLPCAVESGWIDPDTPMKFHSTVAHTNDDKREYALVSKPQNSDSERLLCNQSLIIFLPPSNMMRTGFFWWVRNRGPFVCWWSRPTLDCDWQEWLWVNPFTTSRYKKPHLLSLINHIVVVHKIRYK